MPARKTIAERSAQATQQRRRLALYVLGAVPVAILLVIGGVFLYQRATGLGPNEMPSSISQGDRDDIRAAVERFYEKVNAYNPQQATEVMIPQADTEIEEVNRLVMEVTALEAEALSFQVQALGSTTIDPGGKTVTAQIGTNYGAREFVLTRYAAEWRVAKVPDLIVPQEAGPRSLSWEVTNSYWNDSHRALTVVGTIKNVGEQTGYMLVAGAYIHDGSGRALVTARAPLPGSPFIDPGEAAYFWTSFSVPRDQPDIALDAANFVLVPNFRAAGPNDERTLTKKLDVSPMKLHWQPGQMVVEIRNSEAQAIDTAVFGHLFDASGRLVGVLPVLTAKLAPGETRSVPVPTALPTALAGVASVELTTLGRNSD